MGEGAQEIKAIAAFGAEQISGRGLSASYLETLGTGAPPLSYVGLPKYPTTKRLGNLQHSNLQGAEGVESPSLFLLGLGQRKQELRASLLTFMVKAPDSIGPAGSSLQVIVHGCWLLAGVQMVELQHIGRDDDVLAWGGPPREPKHIEQAQFKLAQDPFRELQGSDAAQVSAEPSPVGHLRDEAGRTTQQYVIKQQC